MQPGSDYPHPPGGIVVFEEVRMMKRLLVFLVLLASFFLIPGCANMREEFGATVAENRDARKRRISQISDLQMKMLAEDWDYFWLFERNSALTQWHPWVGI